MNTQSKPAITITLAAAASYGVGTEVQFKNKPGVPYKVIDAVNNQRALRAVNSADLEVALLHQLEPYCDLEQAEFITKARKVIDECDRVAPDVVAASLWRAGMRLGAVAPVSDTLSDEELVTLTLEVFRYLSVDSGWQHSKHMTEEEAVRTFEDSRNNRLHHFWEKAKRIVNMTRLCEIDDVIDELYPDAREEDPI